MKKYKLNPFKKFFYGAVALLALASGSLHAQTNDNYIIERVYQQAGGKEDSALVTVKYFDGLGRPLQTVAVGMSPSRKDIVTPIGYDALGREHRKYLPYEASSATGLYRPHDLSEAGYRTSDQYKYYRATGGNTNPDIPDTDYPFAETLFEASPLNRVVEQGAPGETWQPLSASIAGSGHTVGMVYGTNAAEEVVRWDVDNSGVLLKDGFYDAGTLYLTQTTDENGVASREYKDLQGQVVLKMAAIDSAVETRTYYVYDDLSRLRYVLPPMFVDSMGTTASFTASSDLVKKFGYYYAYDGRGRMTVKQLPGAGPVRMVYDVRDRLVATQDSVQRDSSKWLITKYDALNRPVATAVYPFSHGQDSLQRYANTFTEGNLYETPDNSKAHGYTERAFPGDVDDSSYLTVTYYDGYTQITAANGFNQLRFVPKPGLIAYAGGNGYFTGTRGLVTGTKTRVLDTNEWLYGVTYYDDRYRPIQTRGTLYGGTAGDGYTASTRYDFSGKVLRAEEVQVFGGVATTITTGNTYDHAGRLLTTTQQVTHNGTSTGTVTVAQNQYSALGQLREKNLANGHQSVDYTYNIRGWLTSINNPDDLTAPSNGDTHADLFGMRLSYSETTATGALPQYNGNIAEAVWSTNHNALKRSAYGYRYDALSRLTGSDYWTTKTSTLVDSSAYEERGISYDLNGNIKTLVRTKGDGTLKDSLAYTYSGNRLTQLNSWNGYDYDGNGNMTTDGMRGFSVEYNLLNLPKKVSKGSDNISYIYSATGAKLAMLDTNTVRNYYAGTCVYKGDRTLDYALHPEGVVRVTTSTSGVKSLSYEYFLKDHLGNTRVVFDGNDSVLQATDYYAFGMAHTPKARENENRYLYNGKEQQDALLSGVQFDWYDYGARFYDPMLGRWHSVDPQAERYNSMSPYSYVANNPMLFIDPNGEEVWIYYTDDEGNEQKMQYKAGMKYDGGNKFISASVKYLNQMSSTEQGGKVLGALIDSENTFNMTNSFAKDENGNDVKGALAFAGSDEGGGQIHAGELLNENLAEGAKLESTAHELFHGYQHENGQGGASIFNEVEAMVFGVAVSTQYSFDNNTIGGGSSTPLGKDNSTASQVYQNSFQSLLYNTTFPKDAFVSAVKNFKQGAAKNTSGGYNNYPLKKSNQTKSLLSRFYPLIN